jgi:hypothetical protein
MAHASIAWTYGKPSTFAPLQTQQNKLLRLMTGTSYFVRNDKLHDLDLERLKTSPEKQHSLLLNLLIGTKTTGRFKNLNKEGFTLWKDTRCALSAQ